MVCPDNRVVLRREMAASLLACGVDPQRSSLFLQSQVKEHAELAWLLGCITPLGWLKRMTQFKDKGKKQDKAGLGLLGYPVLMSADILVYQAASAWCAMCHIVACPSHVWACGDHRGTSW